MSSLCARAIAASLFALGLPAIILADAPTLSLSPGGYTMVSQVRADRDHFFYTYSGVLLNAGPALTGVTATLTSSVSSIQLVSGQSTLEFSPVPAGTPAIPSQTTSTNTFTILVDRTVPFNFSDLVWALNNPFADPGPPQTAPVLSTVTLNGAGSTNPSGIGTLTYSWAFQTLPAGSNAQILNASSAIASFVPDVIGTYVLALTVTNGPQSNTGTVTISTTDVQPTADPGPNQTVMVGALVTLDGTKSSDANGEALTFLWSFVGVPNNSSAVLSNPRSPKPSFVADKDGSYIVGLVVNDGTLSSKQKTVTISTGNTAPVAVANANPQSVNVNGLVQLDGSKSTDVNGNPLTYSWSLNRSGAPGSLAALSNSTIVNPTFTADVAGTYIAQLIVNDGVTSSVPATVTITTNTVLPPTAIPGSSQQVTAGTTVQLQGSGTDPQGLTLTFKWSLTTVPTGSTASLSAASIANPTFVADLPGTYVAQLVVNNGTLSSSPQTVTITSTTLPPVAVPSTTTPVVSLGQLVLLSGSQSTDPQGLPLTFSWSLSIPSGSTATLNSPRSESPSFTPDVAGTYVAQLIVNDGFQNSQPQTVSVSAGLMTIALTPSPLNLTNVPQPLTVTISPAAGSTGVTVGLSGFNPSVISLSSGNVTIPANSSSANVTVTPVAAGNTGIVANAPGYAAATDQVSVTTPTISIAFTNGASGVGLTHVITGTVNLSGPAPPSGTTVNLSVDPSSTGAVSFSPASVAIPAGSTSGGFSITGTQLGNTIIDANATGYSQGQTSVLVVNLGGISISQGLTIGVGESVPLSVRLTTPAPVDGVTVTLKVSDSSTITVSPTTVTIAPRATMPDTPPQVSGVAIGSATIMASAGGYVGDTENVTVSSVVTFSPSSLTLGIGSQQGFTVKLSSPAPASGVIVTLSSNNGDVSVTPSLTFTSGQQSLPATVTGVSSGTSTITATTNNPQVFAGSASLAVTITTALALPCPATTSGEVNAPFSSQFSATGGSTPYTYSVVGTLPAGLTLSTAGLVSGTPTASGSFSIQAKDANGVSATSCVITISTALSLPCPGTVAGEVGTVFNSQVTASGGLAPYTYAVAGTLPSGLSLNASTGAISGTPTVSGTFNIKATDALGVSLSSCTFTIAGALSLPCPATTQGEVSTAFNSQLGATGGQTPYSYSVVGTLPAGLSLNASTGLISGTPTATGTFTVQAKDANGATANSCTLTIGAALSLPCPGATSGEVGVALNTQLSATNGLPPYSYTVAGTLPSGLTLNASTGLVSGTPGTTGSFNIKVTDAAGATATSCAITIAAQLSLPCPGKTGGDVGVVFNSQVTATGGVGPYTYSVATGTLPNGLSLNSSTGAISGTPGGTGSFTVKATDSLGGTATTSCTFTISNAIALQCPINSTGDVGTPFSVQLSPSGGTLPYTFTVVGTLPGGLTLNASTGLVSGTPTTAGSFNVKVTDAVGVAVTLCPFTINTALALPCPTTIAGETGTAFSSQLAPTGGTAPYSFTVLGTLPDGLSLNASTGLLSGTPTSASRFKVQVKDTAGVTVNSCVFSFTAAISLPCPGMTTGEQNVAFSSQLSASGGATPYTYTVVGTLPSGLSLNASTGLISGTPGTAGTFKVQVTDAAGFSAISCTFTISGPFTLPCPATTTGEIGAVFSSQLSAAGGVTPYTYTVVGTLPQGLSLNASTGLVSGTPTTSGSFMVQGKDAEGATAVSCTITITTALTLPCPPTVMGEVGAPFSTQVTATGGVSPYTYTVNGVLPGGLTLNSATGAVTGTPNAGGSFKIQVKDAIGVAVSSCSFTINGTVVLPCPSTTTGEVSIAFSSQLTASNGVGPYTYTVVGTLPQGLSLNASTGLVSGTATTAGTFSVQAKDANGATATSCTLTIATAVSLPTPVTTTGEMGIAFSTQLAATGGVTPYTYTAAGLPTGLTLSSSTGAISGTPTAAGTFTVKVTDALGASAFSSTLTIAATLTLPCPGNNTGDAGAAFSAQLTPANGVSPFTFSVAAGALPTGLTLNASTGLVSGTPQGPGTFSIKVTDKLGATATSCTFTIGSVLSLPCPGNLTGEVGAPFNGQFQASGGSPTYTYSVVGGTLPNGLTLNSSTGVISGTPLTAGSFSVQVKDGTGATATSGCAVTIVAMVTLTCPATNSGAINSPFNATMTPAGGILPYALSLQTGTLPNGLTLTGTTISGTPTVAGAFTYKLTDGAGVLAGTMCSFTIATVPLQFKTTSLPNGAPSVPYSTTIMAIGGTTPYTFSLGATAPSWLQINPVTGVLSGNPSRGSGTFSVPITITDSSTPTQQTVSTTFNLVISQVPLAFTTTSLPDGLVNTSYGQPIVVTGGTQPYNWTITPVSPAQLPTWFIFDPTGAQCATSGPTVCGTPPTFGTISFTISVTDSTSPTAQIASQTFTLTIDTPTGAANLSVAGGNGISNTFSVGQNLEVPLTITFNPVPQANVTLTVTSNSGLITFTGTPVPQGSSPPAPTTTFQVTVPPEPAVTIYVQALGSSGTATITAQAANYKNGTATVNLGKSGFVLSGPGGIGGSFDTFEGVKTPLTLGPALLDSSSLFVEYELVAYSQAFSVPLSVAPSTLGSISPASITFTSGMGSVSGSDVGPNFTASKVNTGGATLSIMQPATFTNPTVGSMVNANIQASGFVPPAVTVGNNLQVQTSIAYNGPAPSNMSVTLQSNDPSKLLFSKTETGTGSGTLVLSTVQGQTSSPNFWVRGYGSSGSVGYTISGGTFGTSNASVTLGQSGLIIQSPAGLGSNFSVSLSTPSATLNVFTALLDGTGNFVTTQEVAADQSISVAVSVSGSPADGTISTSPITIAGATPSATTTFKPSSTGSSFITASSSAGFQPSGAAIQSGSVTATVTSCNLNANNGLTVGQFLEAQAKVFLSCPAGSGGTPVTLTSNSSSLKLAVNPTDPGANQIVVTVPAGQQVGLYYVYGLGNGSSPATATYGAQASGFGSSTDTVILAPSAILISGPNSAFGGFSVGSSAGPQTLTVWTDVLTTDGNNTPTAGGLGQQGIAGNVALTIALTDSAGGAAGTLSSNSVKIAAGAVTGTVTFTPKTANSSTNIQVTQPAGWIGNVGPFGSTDVTQVSISVTP